MRFVLLLMLIQHHVRQSVTFHSVKMVTLLQ